MRWVYRVLAPVIFWVSYRLFRSSIARRSVKQHDAVMRLFRFAADNQSTKALSVYGHLLFFRGVDITNQIQGAIYIQRAAEQGDIKAQYQIAKIFESGFHHQFVVNYEKALHFYTCAGKQLHPLAIKRLIEIYQQGLLGEEANPLRAADWQSKAPNI